MHMFPSFFFAFGWDYFRRFLKETNVDAHAPRRLLINVRNSLRIRYFRTSFLIPGRVWCVGWYTQKIYGLTVVQTMLCLSWTGFDEPHRDLDGSDGWSVAWQTDRLRMGLGSPPQGKQHQG